MLHTGLLLAVSFVGMMIVGIVGLLAEEMMGEQDISIHQVSA